MAWQISSNGHYSTDVLVRIGSWIACFTVHIVQYHFHLSCVTKIDNKDPPTWFWFSSSTILRDKVGELYWGWRNSNAFSNGNLCLIREKINDQTRRSHTEGKVAFATD